MPIAQEQKQKRPASLAGVRPKTDGFENFTENFAEDIINAMGRSAGELAVKSPK
jgi:hypothetical protein